MTVLERKAATLKVAVTSAVKQLYGGAAAEADFAIIRPKLPNHGRFSSTAALALAKMLKRPPVEIAEEIIGELSLEDGDKAVLMGKGFINFFVDSGFLYAELNPLPELPEIQLELPPLESPDFPAAHAACRLWNLLKLRGQRPTGAENLALASEPEEIRLLWAIFDDDPTELRSAALDLYDRLGLEAKTPEASRARYALLANALSLMLRKD